MKTTSQIKELPTRFDDYLIEPCKRSPMEGCPGQFTFEECEAEEANTWTLYGPIPGIGVQMIRHFDTLPEAEEIFSRITGTCYTASKEPDAGKNPEATASKLPNRRPIAIPWTIEDVQYLRPDLDDGQSWQVLEAVEKYLDSNEPITWYTVEREADRLYPQADDE